MKWVYVVVCAGLLAVSTICASAEEQITHIHLISEAWEDATNADGSGLYWDIFRLVYEPVGIKVQIDTMPYMRTVKFIQAQRADALVGSYLGEIGGVLYPEYHFDVDRVVAVFLKDKQVDWQGQQTLENTIVGWVRGYDYDEYLKPVVQKFEVNSRKSGLGMLLRDRLDFFLDAEIEIEYVLEQKGLQDQAVAFQIERALDLRLYLAFANNDRGRRLMKIYDERMKTLVATGALEQLFEASGYKPYPENTWENME